ncbi:hypothetical protein [Bailinhaonella thermotolerans]|nr:hypothetical protein [Bailinhaonella thermotolerans]
MTPHFMEEYIRARQDDALREAAEQRRHVFPRRRSAGRFNLSRKAR